MNITIGSLTVAVIWFVVMMVILEPAIVMTSPPSFYTQYFGSNSVSGIVNSTISNFSRYIAIPLVKQGNSSAGFASSNNLQTFSGLAFVYGAFGMFINTIFNLPKMIYILFVGSASNLSFIPLSLVLIGSIAFIGYIGVSLIYKGISAWMKSDVENIGA